MKNKTTKTAMLAALSAFQMASTTATASEISRYAVAENASQKVLCEVNQLDRAKTLNDWPGTIMYLDTTASNENILKNINENFVGGNYFDAYPHKLPLLFKEGACVVSNK